MSADTMDIDPVSSPEKKRKSKGKDHHSSKKRKHREEESGAVAEADSASKERKEKHRKHKHLDDLDISTERAVPSSQPAVDASPSASRSKKKHSKQLQKDSQPPSPGQKDVETSSVQKPLSKRTGSQLTRDESSSPFHLVTTSLYLPLSPISISETHALQSLLSEHVSPLLLTYFPPVRGIILAYSNPSLSSTQPTVSSSSSPTDSLTPALTAGEYGVLFVYLKVTFLVFRPERSQTLEGWINVQSESFLGAVVFNLFSVGIERRRLPTDWKWIAPGEQQQKQHSSGDDDDSSVDPEKDGFRPIPSSTPGGHDFGTGEDEFSTGFFQTSSGKRVRGVVRFRVRDVDVIPGSERDKGFISLEGTMLSPEDETNLVAEERARAERANGGRAVKNGDASMSGALSSATSDLVGADISTKASTEKPKKKKSKSS
ncbi:hypothetical protein VTO42DRAFT_3667 [Malbranchea cinnamomea]